MRIEKVGGVIGRCQTSRLVDHEQGIGPGMGLCLVATAIRFLGDRSVIAGADGIAGWGQGNVGRPPRTELTAFSDLGVEIVVEGVVGFDWGRTDHLLVVHGSIVRTVSGRLVGSDPLGMCPVGRQ